MAIIYIMDLSFKFQKNLGVESMKIITLDENNIEDEHICCGFSDKKIAEGYSLKKFIFVWS